MSKIEKMLKLNKKTAERMKSRLHINVESFANVEGELESLLKLQKELINLETEIREQKKTIKTAVAIERNSRNLYKH